MHRQPMINRHLHKIEFLFVWAQGHRQKVPTASSIGKDLNY